VAKNQFMTETEWGCCPRVSSMLLQLRPKKSPWKWSTRKARLFGAACCRRVWHLLDNPADRRAVEVAEEVAEKRKRLTDLRAAHEVAGTIDLGPDRSSVASLGGWSSVSSKEWDFCYSLWINPRGRGVCRVAHWASTPTPWGNPYGTANDARVLVAFRTGLAAAKQEDEVQCRLLRDIVGPPVPPAIEGAWLGKNDGAARRLAEALYEEDAFDRLPILGDALEDAGCTDRAILDHCRGPGPHVLGCWVVDLLLGKQ
jgi:hypothetical protein